MSGHQFDFQCIFIRRAYFLNVFLSRQRINMVFDNSLYDLLGVPSNASYEEIQRAYKRKARDLHPDKNRNDPNATQKFQELNEAYQILKDPEKRRNYDQFGLNGMNGFGFDDADNIFRSFMTSFDFPGFGFGFSGFGGRHQRRQKTQDITYKLQVTLEELYNGATKKVFINRQRLCSQCKGRGVKNGCRINKCYNCNGTGFIQRIQRIKQSTIIQHNEDCPKCNGTGEYIKPNEKCPNCNGNKVCEEQGIFEVHILPGTMDGEEYIFKEESNQEPGADTGDVNIILIQKEHDIFTRKNDNLILIKNITLSEALLGELKIPITHLDGRILIASPPQDFVFRDEQVMVIENEGMPSTQNRYQKGDLFIYFHIIFPMQSEITNEFAETIQKYFPIENEAFHIDINAEDVHVVTLEDSNMEDFMNSRKNRYYQNDDSDQEQTEGCQPM